MCWKRGRASMKCIIERWISGPSLPRSASDHNRRKKLGFVKGTDYRPPVFRRPFWWTVSASSRVRDSQNISRHVINEEGSTAIFFLSRAVFIHSSFLWRILVLLISIRFGVELSSALYMSKATLPRPSWIMSSRRYWTRQVETLISRRKISWT